MSDPIRTCVGCGQRDGQRNLARFVLLDGHLALDPVRSRQRGRGAYLHHTPACWSTFVGRRGSVRSLRVTPSVVQRERLVTALSGAAQGSR